MAIVNKPLPTDGDGFFPEECKHIRVTNRTGGAVAVGQVVQLDVFAEATETVETKPGEGTTSIWNNVIPSTADGITASAGPLCIVETIAADNAECLVTVKGCDVDVLADHGTTGNLVAGTALGTSAANAALTMDAGGVTFGIGGKGTIGLTTTDQLVRIAYFDGYGIAPNPLA